MLTIPFLLPLQALAYVSLSTTFSAQQQTLKQRFVMETRLLMLEKA